MAEATPPETLGFREFATLRGCKPGYITELRKAGRLVLTDDGQRVRVAESIRLIEDTRDPARAGVAARHAATRSLAAASPVDADVPSDSGVAAGEAPDSAPASFDDPHTRRRAKALADSAEADARKKLRDEQVELGQLLEADQVRDAIAGAVTLLRNSLGNLSTNLAPELAAEQDESRVRVILDTAIESLLEDLARRCGAVGRGEAPAVAS